MKSASFSCHKADFIAKRFHPPQVDFFRNGGFSQKDSNYTPRSPNRLWCLTRCVLLRPRATLAEQPSPPRWQASLPARLAWLSVPPILAIGGAVVRLFPSTEKGHTPQGGMCPFSGGEGETRTLAPGLIRPTPLAGAPRHQLEYFSIHQAQACRLQNLQVIL